MSYIERKLLIDDINHTLFYDNRDRATVKALALSLPGVDAVEVKHEESKKQTNFDRIKAMGVEELAELLDYTNSGDLITDVCDSAYCDEWSEESVKCSGNCVKAIINWLECEVAK